MTAALYARHGAYVNASKQQLPMATPDMLVKVCR